MNKKGAAQLMFFGIPVATLIWLYFSIFVIGPELDEAIGNVLDQLGDDTICPEDFKVGQGKLCFNAKGDVIADGIIDDSVTIKVSGTSNSCRIEAGNYDFEYSGCRLDKFKQMTAYNFIMISNRGTVSISGLTLSKQIMSRSGIIKVTPKGIKLAKRLSYFIKFL